MRAGEHPDFAFERTVPGRRGDALCKHAVEQVRARGRQRETALAAPESRTPEQRRGEPQVLAIPSEALLAEIVRRAERLYPLEYAFGRATVTVHFAQVDAEAVAAMRATLDLAWMTPGVQHVHAVDRERLPVRIRLARQLHGERLPGQRMAVLEARETDRERRQAERRRETACDPFGVRVALLDAHEHVLAMAFGLETEILVDFKVLGVRAQHAAQRWPAMGERQFAHGKVSRSSRATSDRRSGSSGISG